MKRPCTLCSKVVVAPADKRIAQRVGAVMFYEGTCVECAQELVERTVTCDIELTDVAPIVLSTLDVVHQHAMGG